MSDSQRVALVTGAGRGIGRGIARKLADDGFTVVVNATSASADETAKAIRETGGAAEPFQADISSSEDRRGMINFISERFGRLDLLVNNAGVAPKERKDVLEGTEDSFDRLISINLKGPYFLTQLAANRMLEWKRTGVVDSPRIVFVSSISAYTSSPSRGEYCVSKAGLSMAAMLFSHRLAEEGVPVLELCPGIIETDMTSGVKEKYDRLIADGLVPMRRWGTPGDIARAVSAVARGDFDFATGASIELGGGFGLRRL